MTPEVKNEILKLKSEGKGYGEIAKLLNLHKSTIAKFFQKHAKDGFSKNVVICPVCGKKFFQISGPTDKRFCSKECKYKWWNTDALKKKRTYTLKCQHCGKLFNSINKKAKFCSRECYFNERFGK